MNSHFRIPLTWGLIALTLAAALIWSPSQKAVQDARRERNQARPAKVASALPDADGGQDSTTARTKPKRELIAAAHLLTDSVGWAMSQSRLLWTTDAGQDWRDITPGGPKPRALDGVFFVDIDRGWVLLSSPGGGDDPPALELAITTDG